MKEYEDILKNYVPNEVEGKFFVLDRAQQKWIQGWIAIDSNLKAFTKSLKEEIDYSWNLDHIFIENFSIFYINTDNNALVEIKDNKTLSIARRRELVLIVLLDKSVKFRTIKDIKPLYDWYSTNIKEISS
ncbi:MAG: hypothetical protein EAX89_11165 [Candidatus Lokiarchaeota archaeon]|nr:hypothetical protein [Candidatus Lokiarchaeota archaeon]